MSKAIGLGLIVSLFLLPLAWSEAAQSLPAESPSIEKLIDQLGDPEYSKRDAATQQITAIGPAALPALLKAKEHDDPEIRRRVAELIPALETAALLAPKRVTLHVERKPIRQIIASVAEQTGYKIECTNSNEQQVYDFDFDNQPFWQTIDQLCRSAGLNLQQSYGDDRLRLFQQDNYVPYICYDGPVRVVANSFQHFQSIDFSSLPRNHASSQRSESLNFTFSLYVEPRLPLLGMGEPKLTAAWDNLNQSMLMPNQSVDLGMDSLGPGRRWITRYGNGFRSYSHPAQVNLLRTSAKAQSVKVIQGSIPVLLLTDQKPEVITDQVLASKGTKAKVGATSFSIENVTEPQAKQQYQIKMTISEENKDNPNDYTWINSLSQRIDVQDEQGGKYQTMLNSMTNRGPNVAELLLTFTKGNNPKLGPPAKLVYSNWTTVQHHVRFEFRDLPLP